MECFEVFFTKNVTCFCVKTHFPKIKVIPRFPEFYKFSLYFCLVLSRSNVIKYNIGYIHYMINVNQKISQNMLQLLLRRFMPKYLVV